MLREKKDGEGIHPPLLSAMWLLLWVPLHYLRVMSSAFPLLAVTARVVPEPSVARFGKGVRDKGFASNNSSLQALPNRMGDLKLPSPAGRVGKATRPRSCLRRGPEGVAALPLRASRAGCCSARSASARSRISLAATGVGLSSARATARSAQQTWWSVRGRGGEGAASPADGG